MKNIQQIEDWIEAIESSNISAKKQEQHISEVVDFWKFATTYDNHLSILEKGKVLIQENGISQEVTIATANLNLSKRINPFETVIAEIETELLTFGTKYLGLYNIRFHNLNRNFLQEDLALVKQEILSAIKGEIVFFKYIYKLNKIEATELKIFKNDLGVLQCNFKDIQKKVAKIKPQADLANQWLVLFLDTIDHNCDYFLLERKAREAFFKTDYDKVFIFDFYKSEILPLRIVKDNKKPDRQAVNAINKVQDFFNVTA